ncbi:ABC transporter ATP-binding protein [Dactylosporangium matsuzakiense]|uniref:Multidrug ABC transporter permease n=1 Tax=Dactylosporangium matsuzakiense TaxID=53360 RepID=A0A9W6KKE8_9ACTN|nr:ABC transporter ATP-binding protein [Dactylosporangium matsuzakiense]GLL02134.1 multidrug ABC transporter permease [Dactylosporangium matsuzakiense]
MRERESVRRQASYGIHSAVLLTRLVWSVPKRDVMPFAGLLLLSSLVGVAQPVLLGSVIGGIVKVASGREGLGRLIALLFGLLATLLVNAALQAGTAVAATRLERSADGVVRQRIRSVTATDPGMSRIEDPAVRDDAVSVREGAHGVALGAAAADGVRVVFQYVNALLLAAVVAEASVPSAAVLLGAIVLARLFSVNLGVRRGIPRLATSAIEQRAVYFRELIMGSRSAKEVRVFGTGEWLINEMTGLWNSFYGPVFAVRRGYLWQFTLLYLGLAAAYLLALLPLMLATVDGREALARFAAALSAAAVMLLCVAQTFTRYLLVGEPLRAYERLQAHAPDGVPPAGPAHVPATAPIGEIRFEGVVFHYPGSAVRVFDGLDLVLRARESVGLVGINGAGKTTLVKLLARMYEPDAGRILVDGVDLRTLDAGEWRSRLAVLFQDFVRYELSMADNIRFGRLTLPSDSAVLEEVVHEAGLDDVVARLPAGLSTPLSTSYRGGTDLSGGEWQRTALARALYALRGGAGVLVLDEPTAAYDIRAEEELFSRFLDLTKGVTTLLISHRLSAVRRAQRIIVLSGGRIVEDGTHAALMTLGGTYAEMFKLQARTVRDGADASSPRSAAR